MCKIREGWEPVQSSLLPCCSHGTHGYLLQNPKFLSTLQPWTCRHLEQKGWHWSGCLRLWLRSLISEIRCRLWTCALSPASFFPFYPKEWGSWCTHGAQVMTPHSTHPISPLHFGRADPAYWAFLHLLLSSELQPSRPRSKTSSSGNCPDACRQGLPSTCTVVWGTSCPVASCLPCAPSLWSEVSGGHQGARHSLVGLLLPKEIVGRRGRQEAAADPRPSTGSEQAGE